MSEWIRTYSGHARRYPNEELFGDDHDEWCGDFGSFLSTLLMESMMGERVFELGDSGVTVETDAGLMTQGPEGLEHLKEAAYQLVDALERAIPVMSSEPHKKACQYALRDFRTNGLSMPMQGKII